MSKLFVNTIRCNLVTCLIIGEILTVCVWPACSATQDHIFFPINNSTWTLTKNNLDVNYNNNISVVPATKPSNISTIKPDVLLNNKTESVTEKDVGWRWKFPSWTKRKKEEKEIITTTTEVDDAFGAKETKPKSKNRSWMWPTLIIVIIVCVIAGICADNKSIINLLINRSNNRNTPVDTGQTPGAPENTRTNGTLPNNVEGTRLFRFPNLRAQQSQSQDNPPPYPGPPVPELTTPTSPPPSYVTLGLKNDAQFSRT